MKKNNQESDLKGRTENNIRETLDALFVVSSEACAGEGEDSFCGSCSNECAMIGVFDGCGGLGSRKYDHFEGHTGAYIASRVASGAVYDWFVLNHSNMLNCLYEPEKKVIRTAPSSLKDRIVRALSLAKEQEGPSSL